MKLYILFILPYLISCQSSEEKNISVKSVIDTISYRDTTQRTDENTFAKDTIQLIEFFTDSLNIGKKSFNKIEVSLYRSDDSNYVSPPSVPTPSSGDVSASNSQPLNEFSGRTRRHTEKKKQS